MKNIMKLLILNIFILCSLEGTHAQTPQIAIDNPDVRIFPSDNPQSEVHISINKTNPLNIIASANTTLHNQGYYYSNDGGITWNGSDNLPSSGAGDGDPTTSFDASGRAYITTMTVGQDGYYAQHSDDECFTWSSQVRGLGPTSSVFDKEMIVTVDDMQSSPYANNFYCAWTDFNTSGYRVKINRSTDRTATFTNTSTISSSYGQGTNVQIGPNGQVYVCWANYTNGGIPAQHMGFAVSTDGGITYTSSTPFAYNGIRVGNGPNSNYGNTRINDYPSMAVDKSCGPNRGRIYIAYPEIDPNNSNRSIIQVRSSIDNGSTWTSPATISIPNSTQNWFPWIAVDDLTGLVNVAYFAFDHPDYALSTNTWVAYSTDAFATWQNIRVSDLGHNTGPISGYSPGYAGDYIGIASFDGKSYAAWMDNRSGQWQIWVSRIDYNISKITSSQTSLSINSPSTIRGSRTYQASTDMTVCNISPVAIQNNSNINFFAGNSININNGFTAEPNFNAEITTFTPCTTPGATLSVVRVPWSNDVDVLKGENGRIQAFAYPNPSVDFLTIGCKNNCFKNVTISIYDSKGHEIHYSKPEYISEEQIRTIIDVRNLASGMYIFSVNADGETFNGKFLKQGK